jgi:hypothetical protein
MRWINYFSKCFQHSSATPRIRTLRLRHLLPEAAGILKCLKAPIISSLDIGFRPYEGDDGVYREYDPEDWDVDFDFDHPHVEDEFSDPLWTFLQDGSQTTLRYLRIHGAFLEYGLLDKLWRIQSLRHLCLDDSMYDHDMQDFPRIWGIVPHRLPNLEVLAWRNFPVETAGVETVKEILQERGIELIYTPDIYCIWSG